MHLKSLHDNTVKRLADLTLKRLDSILEMTTRCISVHADSQHCITAARSIAPRCRLPHYTPQTFAVEWQVRRPRQRECFEGELVWLPCCHIFLKCWKSTAIGLSSFVTYVWAKNATFGKPVIAVLSSGNLWSLGISQQQTPQSLSRPERQVRSPDAF